MQVKSFLLTMGAGIAVGALGAMMLPKNSEVYQFTNDAASTIKQEAEKAIQSMTNRGKILAFRKNNACFFCRRVLLY